MSVTDPIADMLTQMRNALRGGKVDVELPASRLKVEIARILKEHGKIKRYEVQTREQNQFLKIYFQSVIPGKRPMLSFLKRVSRPGRREYVGYQKIPQILGKYGLTIISTSRGIMSGKVARQAKLGGEVLCQVY